MKADSPLVAALAPSPNHDERQGEIEILLLHYTGMTSGDAALARLRDPAAKVSCHYFVEEDGRVTQLVAESRRAWHAGAGSWRGQPDVNSRSIGIEIVNPGHANGYRAFPEVQIAAVIELCRDCVERHAIAPEMVLAHSDTAPDRKEDPGELFPWDQLFAARIGTWVQGGSPEGDAGLVMGDEGSAVFSLQTALARFGYAVEPTGHYDETTRLAVLAFQRHYRQAQVDGRADRSTLDVLERLLAASRRR